nr:MAG TPA: hypothetical protein [Caudoviricetes sp.]
MLFFGCNCERLICVLMTFIFYYFTNKHFYDFVFCYERRKSRSS